VDVDERIKILLRRLLLQLLQAGAVGMKAHQRVVREKMASSLYERGLFGEWWGGIDTTPANAVVTEISIGTAKAIIDKYEWMGCMAAVTFYCYGLYFDGNCAGVVCYGPEYSENLGRQAREAGRKYLGIELNPKYIELANDRLKQGMLL